MANSQRSKHSSRDVPSVDRISALPDSLLCHIISYLPTHFAVQTTILSKRWTNLWTSLTSLHFDDDLFRYYDNDKRFQRFVYRVLLLLKTPPLHKFFLFMSEDLDPYHVNAWVSAALSRDVRELIITVSISESFDIPVSLFTSKTLSYLSLIANTMLNVPNSVCLPNLKYLHLSSVQYVNDESVRKLLSSCRVLEKLFIERDFNLRDGHLDNVVRFSICSSTLKSLKLIFISDCQPVDPRHTLEIDSPMLQCLFLYDCISSDYGIGNLSSLVEANIDIIDRDLDNNENVYGDNILKLFNGLSHANFLKLSGATLKVLIYTHELAENLPNLAELEGNFSPSKHESWSIHPEHVPKCLFSHIGTVEITKFDGSTNELMMVKFILINAKSLERMTIVASHPETKFDLLQEISKFPRGSEKCELVVS